MKYTQSELRHSLSIEQLEWLHHLMGDWQLISDLTFSDLSMLVRMGQNDSARWACLAHIRPNTGPLVFDEDVVGEVLIEDEGVEQAYRSGVIVRSDDVVERFGGHVMEDAIPVLRDGVVIAVVARHFTTQSRAASHSHLEDTYRMLGGELAAMVARGEFPSTEAPTGVRRGAPRVGDGVIHLDGDAQVLYASPNAISALHRLGHHEQVPGTSLPQVVSSLPSQSPVDESLALVVTGRAPWRSEVVANGATVTLRAIPLTRSGTRYAAIVLLRDVSELRRREQELLTKDAMIREIHHRVKNNLQNVAALLRMQARRVDDPAGKAALDEAVRRVGAIALVHDRLSHSVKESVSFDDLAVDIVQSVLDVSPPEHPIERVMTGSFGQLQADEASTVAVVLSELVQNAAEHGLGNRAGRVTIDAQRDGDNRLQMIVTDDGVGMPSDFRAGATGLGTQIVRTLIENLGGTIEWGPAEPTGTAVRVSMKV